MSMKAVDRGVPVQAISVGVPKFSIKRATVERKNNKNTCCKIRLQHSGWIWLEFPEEPLAR